MEAHVSNLKENASKEVGGAHTSGVTDKKGKKSKDGVILATLKTEQKEILDQYNLLEELIMAKKKQLNRSIIKLSATLLRISGNFAKAIPEVTAVATGSALVTGATALEMGAAAARKTKQAGRDKATQDGLGGATARTAGFDSSKSTAAKRDRRQRFSEDLCNQTTKLTEDHGTRKDWIDKRHEHDKLRKKIVKKEIGTWKKDKETVKMKKNDPNKYQEAYKNKTLEVNKANPQITIPKAEVEADYKKNNIMLKSVGINDIKLKEFYDKPDNFQKAIYKGLVNRDL